ncbi:hypothetical protein Cgig2_001007 [Carnegiea gigantea]|uniref:peroxidase n=1 Tax=Carnegiea gigantea TaxID=171969 RepID=A0A9Q1JK06_9CARY|nr:hypothetical protein Cgig2_001007 [Carnegiea gigantea]
MASAFFGSSFSLLLLVLSSLALAKAQVPIVPGLSYTFYDSSCPSLEFIIRDYLFDVFQNDTTQAASLLRLHFHDCFVQGCDGSVLLDGSASGPSEQAAPPNLTFRKETFKIINDLQAFIQDECGSNVVSCADIAALAARDSVFLSGGPDYFVPLGRRDSLNFATPNDTLANLPSPFANTTTILNDFAKKNLTTTDTVALSGGHTIGISHCASFTNRLYPTQDSDMDQTFADNLKLTCPTTNTTNTTNLDICTPNTFDNKYFVDLMNRQGLLTSDQELYNDTRTKDIVKSFALNQSLFFEKFVQGMIKMGQLGVLTGSQGEIRANCSVRNSDNLGLRSMVEKAGKLSDGKCPSANSVWAVLHILQFKLPKLDYYYQKDVMDQSYLTVQQVVLARKMQLRTSLIQAQCGPKVVSCADITALAARDSVFLSGGPDYNIPLGRRDSPNFASQNVTQTSLPSPLMNTTTILNIFSQKNLTTADTVALSGGHTIGIGHCTSFANRLYPTRDPNMDPSFASNLKLICPTTNTTNTTVLDIRSPNTFDNKYYVDLMNRQGFFTSDQGLYNDSRTKNIVTNFAVNRTLFFEKFVEGMLKMGQLGVLTGSQGEIRANCSTKNSNDLGLWSVVGDGDGDQQEGKLSQY